jgi:hypothetical protein
LVRPVPPRTGGALLVVVTAIFAGLEMYDVLGGWIIPGIDFLPLRHAAESLLRGESVYTDPTFVYPPTAAVLLLPTAAGPVGAAFAWWVLLGVAALLLTAVLVAGAAPAPYRLMVFGSAAFGLTGGVLATRSLFLGNLSELLVPVAAGALLAFHRDRWVLGCALLAASLLVKPLLAPLLLVPVLHRRWGALATTVLPAGAVLLVAMPLVPGGTDFPAVLRYCLAGTNLHGDNAVNNLSLRGWAEAGGMPHLLGAAASVAVLLAVAAGIVRALRAGRPSPVWLGNLVLLGTFLAGAISEVHFLLIAYAAALLHLILCRCPRRVWPRFVPGLALLAVPASYLTLALGPAAEGQAWFVLAELLLLAALLSAPPDRAAATTTAPDRVAAGAAG